MKNLFYILGVGLIAVIIIHLFSTRLSETKNIFYQLPPQENNIIMPRYHGHRSHWHRPHWRRRHHPHFKYNQLTNSMPGFTHMHRFSNKFPGHKMHMPDIKIPASMHTPKTEGGKGSAAMNQSVIPVVYMGPRSHTDKDRRHHTKPPTKHNKVNVK